MNITSTYPVRIPLLLQHAGAPQGTAGHLWPHRMKFLLGRMLLDAWDDARELHGEPGEPCCRLE